MRASAQLLVMLAFAAPAALAQAPPPPTATPPFELALALDVHKDLSCSRSHESRATRGTLRLAMSATSEARLTLTVDETTVTGPSLGAFRQGQRGSFAVHSKSRSTWTGEAEATTDGLVFRFDHLEAARIEAAGAPPVAVLPAPTESAVSLTLTCRPLVIPVYPPAGPHAAPAYPTDEKPTDSRVLSCVPSGSVYDGIDASLVDWGMPFTEGAGLLVASSAAMSRGSAVVRLAR